MPPLPAVTWPKDKQNLFLLGAARIRLFCKVNQITSPVIEAVPEEDWPFSHCAYYRPLYIRICLEHCAYPCGVAESRNWNWPASVTDREPYGVLCHELGHHCDVISSIDPGSYYGDYAERVREWSKEAPITSYCPDDGEWFAEMFRLFVTNPALLREIRPQAYRAIRLSYKPIEFSSWEYALGDNVPPRILRTLHNKGAGTVRAARS